MPYDFTQETFVAAVREKYPQYSDMSDEDLYSKVSTKYPQYVEKVDPVSTTDHFAKNYNTQLDPANETNFQSWLGEGKEKYDVDLQPDLNTYDLRGYWVNGGATDEAFRQRQGHAPDTWKKPNHPTFSDESIYHGRERPGGGTWQGGHWEGETFVPADRGGQGGQGSASRPSPQPSPSSGRGSISTGDIVTEQTANVGYQLGGDLASSVLAIADLPRTLASNAIGMYHAVRRDLNPNYDEEWKAKHPDRAAELKPYYKTRPIQGLAETVNAGEEAHADQQAVMKSAGLPAKIGYNLADSAWRIGLTLAELEAMGPLKLPRIPQMAQPASKAAALTFAITPGDTSERTTAAAHMAAMMLTPIAAGFAKTTVGAIAANTALNANVNTLNGAYPEAFASAQATAKAHGEDWTNPKIKAKHLAETLPQLVLYDLLFGLTGQSSNVQAKKAAAELRKAMVEDRKEKGAAPEEAEAQQQAAEEIHARAVDANAELAKQAPVEETAATAPTDQILENRQALAEGIKPGADTTIFGARNQEVPAQYALVPRESIVTSHDPVTFARNPEYPLENTRDYTAPGEQEKALAVRTDFRPEKQIVDSPDAAVGPPVVARVTGQDGIERLVTIGGNTRAMATKAMRPEQQAALFKLTKARAERFGVSPPENANQELVRFVGDFDARRPEDRAKLQGMVDALNQSPGKVQNLAEMARVDAETNVPIERFAGLSMDIPAIAAQTEVARLIAEGKLDRNLRAQLAESPAHAQDYIRRLQVNAAFKNPALAEFQGQSGTRNAAAVGLVETATPAVLEMRRRGMADLADAFSRGMATIAEYYSKEPDIKAALEKASRQTEMDPQQAVVNDIAAELARRVVLNKGERIDAQGTVEKFAEFWGKVKESVAKWQAEPDLLGEKRSPEEVVRALITGKTTESKPIPEKLLNSNEAIALGTRFAGNPAFIKEGKRRYDAATAETERLSAAGQIDDALALIQAGYLWREAYQTAEGKDLQPIGQTGTITSESVRGGQDETATISTQRNVGTEKGTSSGNPEGSAPTHKGAQRQGRKENQLETYTADDLTPQQASKLADAGIAVHRSGPRAQDPESPYTPDGKAEFDSPLAVRIVPEASRKGVKTTEWVKEKLGGLDKVKPLEMPEMLKLAQKLGVTDFQLRKFHQKYGHFKGEPGKATIALDRRIFQDSRLAAQVLAHEIGHAHDWFPDETLKRGNLLGRLMSLHEFLRNQLDVTGVSNKDLRKEALELTHWWKPWDEAAAGDTYNQYRKSSKELFADIVSVVLNCPAELKNRAPIVYRKFMDGLDAKPEAKKAFLELWDFVNRPEMDVYRDREYEIKDMFVKGDEILQKKTQERELRQTTLRGTFDRWKIFYSNRYAPAQRLADADKARGVKLTWDNNPEALLDEHPFSENITVRILQNMRDTVVKPIEDAGMSIADLGTFLFNNRIANERYDITKQLKGETTTEAGGRAVVANPLGITPEVAQRQLFHMRSTLGMERMTVLEAAARKFQDAVFAEVERAVELGTYNREMFEKVLTPNRYNYATFVTLEALEKSEHVPAGIRRSLGTFKEIGNPYTETLLKMFTLARLNQYNKTKSAVIESAERNGEAERAPLGWRGGRQEPKPPPEGKEAFMRLVDGKPEHWYVPKDLADMFERQSPAMNEGVTGVLNTAFRKIFYPVWIKYNPIWSLLRNPIKDFRRTWRNLPSEMGVGGWKLARAYSENWNSAVARLKGETDPLIAEMFENFAIAPPYESYTSNLYRNDYFGKMLSDYGLLPEAEQSRIRKSKILKPAVWLGDKIQYYGQILESLPKIAAYKLIREDMRMAPRDAATYVRTYSGTPNYMAKGSHIDRVQGIYVFANIAMQGYKADIGAATQSASRSGHWYRWALTNGVPTTLKAAAAAGLLGAGLKAYFDGISDYDKTNYDILPIGTSPGGEFGKKVHYLRLMKDENARLIDGALYKMLTYLMTGGQDGWKHWTSLIGYAEGQLPSVNPIIDTVRTWGQFVAGQNPIDYFRGNPILTNDEWLAGGVQGVKKMVTWNVKELGLSAWITNPFYKVTDYGYREQQTSEQRLTQQERAMMKLLLNDDVHANMNLYNRLSSIPKDKRTSQQRTTYYRVKAWHDVTYAPRMENMLHYSDAGNAKRARGIAKELNNVTTAFTE